MRVILDGTPTGANPLENRCGYSYRSASIGCIFAAFEAGYAPKNTPVASENSNAKITALIGGHVMSKTAELAIMPLSLIHI